MITLRKYLEAQLHYYERELSIYRERLNGYQQYEGTSLHADIKSRDHIYYSTYTSTPEGRTRDYIGRENQTVTDLKEREFLKTYISELESVCNTLKLLSERVTIPSTAQIEEMLKPAYRSYKPVSHRHKTAEELSWLSKAEEFKRQHPISFAEPQIRASQSTNTRTKSEAICTGKLEEYNIAYVFECPIMISGKLRYPDFLIYINGKIFIWEHLGMMYKKEYFDKQLVKLQEYAAEGYIPGVNLFFTFDSPDGTIDVIAVENVILNMLNIAYAS